MTRSNTRPREHDGAAPPLVDLCQSGPALRVLLTTQLLGAVVTLLAAPRGGWLAAQSAAAFALLLATLGWLAGLCAARRALAGLSSGSRAALAAGWAVVCALVALAAVAWAGLVDADWRSIGGATGCAALFGFAAWRGFEMRARLAQPALSQARLAQLQARIRPHFLFNALNAALALVRVDPDRAERVLEDLSVLFRQAMAEEGQAVPLSTEIELARRYLDIEQVRFGDRLRVTWDIDPAAGRARVPPLVLQPLVENAVRHGVEPSPEGSDVHVGARVRQGIVHVVVSNTLSGQPSSPGSGIALANVGERLRLLHDVGAHVEARIEREQDGGAGERRFVARISLPL